jgi:hypothetical protein
MTILRCLGGLGAALLLCTLSSGCAVPLAEACPGCRTLQLGERPPVPKGTRTVFLLLPGLLGYGWEWDGAQKELGALSDAVTLVWPWQPWHSLARSGDALTEHLEYLLRRLPRSVDKVVVIGHSAAGLLLLWAASRLQLPLSSPSVELVAIGAPLAGQGFNPWSGQDLWQTPLPIALGSTFSPWPAPAPSVKLRVFVTGPSDPVMTPHFGHDPGSRAVLPAGTQTVELPRSLDHNFALGHLAKQFREAVLLARPAPAGRPIWPKAAQ